MNALICPDNDGKGHISELIVDYCGDMNLLIHEGNKIEDLFLKDVTVPEPSFTNNSEFNIAQIIIQRQLEVGEMDKWNKIINICMGVSAETSTGVHHLSTMETTGTEHQK